MTLLARLEAAEAGSRELDARLFWHFDRNAATRAFNNAATGRPRELPDEFDLLPLGLGRMGVVFAAPAYTASIDAAKALIERVLPGWVWQINLDRDETRVEGAPIWWPHYENAVENGGVTTDAPTPALAMCIALIRAVEARDV